MIVDALKELMNSPGVSMHDTPNVTKKLETKTGKGVKKPFKRKKRKYVRRKKYVPPQKKAKKQLEEVKAKK